MHKSKIRLIAADLDGTLLDSRGSLTEDTIQALLAASKAGLHTTVATGRSLTAIPECVLKLGCIEYAITSNGASIYRISDKERVYGNDMPQTLVEAVAGIFALYSYPIEVFIQGQAYTTADYYTCPQVFGVSGQSAAYVKATRQPVDDIYHFIRQNKGRIEAMDMVIDDMALKAQIRSRLEQLDNIYVTTSAAHYIECGHADSSKAHALGVLISRLCIDRDEVMAFGDGENDLEMLEYAGIGVAMGNACARLKDAADLSADSNDRNGVAKMVAALLKSY